MSYNVIPCDKFDVNNLSFSPLDMENAYNNASMISFPRYLYEFGELDYVEDKLTFETDWIKIVKYGFPSKGTKPGDFYLVGDRHFINVPLDPNQDAMR